MEELYQSNPSSDMSEEIRSCLDAGLHRDINTLCALIQIQLNDLGNAYTNIGCLISMVDPSKVDEFNTASMFSLQEVAHIINSLLGDEREVSLDPEEKTDVSE